MLCHSYVPSIILPRSPSEKPSLLSRPAHSLQFIFLLSCLSPSRKRPCWVLSHSFAVGMTPVEGSSLSLSRATSHLRSLLSPHGEAEAFFPQADIDVSTSALYFPKLLTSCFLINFLIQGKYHASSCMAFYISELMAVTGISSDLMILVAFPNHNDFMIL